MAPINPGASAVFVRRHPSCVDIPAPPLTFAEHCVQPLKATSTQPNPEIQLFFFFKEA